MIREKGSKGSNDPRRALDRIERIEIAPDRIVRIELILSVGPHFRPLSRLFFASVRHPVRADLTAPGVAGNLAAVVTGFGGGKSKEPSTDGTSTDSTDRNRVVPSA